MTADYQIFLCDRAGNRSQSIAAYEKLTYTVVDNAVGALSMTVDRDLISDAAIQEDLRIEVWRRPAGGTWHQEGDGPWLLQGDIPGIASDGRRYRRLTAVTANHLLGRRLVLYPSESAYAAKSGPADNVMRAIVRENLGNSANDSTASSISGIQFRDWSSTLDVQSDLSLGPSITKQFAWRNVLTVLQEIADDSANLGAPMFFDIVQGSGKLEFRCYLGTRGVDRTTDARRLVVSSSRGSLGGTVERVMDWSKMATAVIVGGQGQKEARSITGAIDPYKVKASPWGRREAWLDATHLTTIASLTAEASAELLSRRQVKTLKGDLVSVPGAMYGVDWGRGDRLLADFEGEIFPVRIDSVTVTVDDSGEDIKATLRADDASSAVGGGSVGGTGAGAGGGAPNLNGIVTQLLARITSLEDRLDRQGTSEVRSYGRNAPQWYNVADYATPQACADAIATAGGNGFMWFPPGVFSLTAQLRIHSSGTYIVADSSSTRIQVNHNVRPAILFQGPSDLGIDHNGILGGWFNVANETASSNFEGDATYSALVGIDKCNDVLIQDVHVWGSGANVVVQCGTVNHVHGCHRLTVNECTFHYLDAGVRILGLEYLHILGGKWDWDGPDLGAPGLATLGAAVHFTGPLSAYGQDGVKLTDMFTEASKYGLLMDHTSNGISNVEIVGCHFDGPQIAGVAIVPGGGADVNGLVVDAGTKINCNPATHSTGVLIQPVGTGGGVIQKIKVNGTIEGAGDNGVTIYAATGPNHIINVEVLAAEIVNCGRMATNTYAGVVVVGGNDTTSWTARGVTVAGCKISSLTASSLPVLAWGVLIGANALDVTVRGNDCPGMGSGAVSKGTASSHTIVYDGNTGDPTPKAVRYVGPFYAPNFGASHATAYLEIAVGSNIYDLAQIRAGRITGIALAVSAIDTTAANRWCTATVYVNGAGKTISLTYTPNGATYGAVIAQTAGDNYASGDAIEVKLQTGAGWSATTDVAVWVEVMDD